MERGQGGTLGEHTWETHLGDTSRGEHTWEHTWGSTPAQQVRLVFHSALGWASGGPGSGRKDLGHLVSQSANL